MKKASQIKLMRR